MSTPVVTQSVSPEVPPPPPRRSAAGRAFGALILAFLVIAVFLVQIAWGLRLVTPWYLPIGGTLALLLACSAFASRRTVLRFGTLVVCALLASFEWFFVLGASALPAYTGPLQEGVPFPPFHTTLADGTDMTEQTFHESPATVVIFFQGRWCPFCMTQLKELETHFGEFSRSNTRVVVASIEDRQTADQTQQDFPHLTVVADEQRELSNAVDLINRGSTPDGRDCAIPTMLLVDRAGIVRWIHRPARFISRPSASEVAAIVQQRIKS